MKKLIVYGIGSFSRNLIKEFVKKKIKIDFIIDQKTCLKKFLGINIKKFSYFKKFNLKNYNCLIALNNHYINVKSLSYKLKERFNRVYSPINYPNISNIFSFNNCYWLSKKK